MSNLLSRWHIPKAKDLCSVISFYSSRHLSWCLESTKLRASEISWLNLLVDRKRDQTSDTSWDFRSINILLIRGKEVTVIPTSIHYANLCLHHQVKLFSWLNCYWIQDLPILGKVFCILTSSFVPTFALLKWGSLFNIVVQIQDTRNS